MRSRQNSRSPLRFQRKGALTGFCCAETECDGGKAPCSPVPVFAAAAKAR